MIRNLPLKLSVIVWLLVLVSGCGAGEREQNVVSVSIAPIKFFVDRLTDNALEVNVMVPQGASHGTYSPNASQMQKLSDSRLYIRIGSLGYEQAFIRRMREINPTMTAIDLNDGIDLIRGEAIDHGDHIHEGGIDPHIWMSPKVMLGRIAVIRDQLIDLFPELEETIVANYPELVEDVRKVHENMQRTVDGLTHKRFLIFHPALTYLARDYGMEQVSIEHEGKEPSPARLSRLIREARADDIPVIFIQEEYDVRNAELVAAETGAQIVTINHLAYDWIANMNSLMETFNQYLR